MKTTYPLTVGEEFLLTALGGVEQVISEADSILRRHGVSRSLYTAAEMERIRQGRRGSKCRLKFPFEPGTSTWNTIAGLLESARAAGKEGPVAQYLVGAKLAMRFPRKEFANQSFSTADVQTERAGDYQLGDMPIHVTVAPMEGVFEKCARNIGAGLRPLLLVPDHYVAAAQSNADLRGLRGLAVESLESYVALNCDELSEGSRELHPAQLRRLLELYNSRVDQVEIDKSLLIDIPPLIAQAKAGDAR